MDLTGLQKKIYDQIINRDYPKNTANVYAKKIYDLAQYYTTNKPEDLEFEDIKKYIHHQWKVSKKPPNSINLMLSTFKFFFNDLHRKKIQFDLIEKPSKERREVQVLSINEIQKLFESCDTLKIKAIMALVYGCGLEIGEALSVKFADINSKTNTLIVKNKKKKIFKDLFISNSIIDLLKEYYKQYRPKTWLFEGKKVSEPYSARQTYTSFKNVVDKSKIGKDLNLTILKYCYIKHTEEMGVPLATVLSTLTIGHTNSFEFYCKMGVDPVDKVRISPFDRLFKKQIPVTKKTIDEFWEILHPKIKTLAHGKFNNKYYADSVETCLKELNSIIKAIVKIKTGEEYDGASLMNRAFSPKEPIIELSDLSTESGQNIQKGYLQIYSGAMTGIRNPKTHQNIEIDRERAVHLLFLASQLFFMLDDYKPI